MRTTMLTLFASMAALAQTPAQTEFEVASIRPSADQIMGGQVNVGLHIDGALLRCNYFSLKEYIGMAYDVKLHQVIGPDWMASARFDISAKIPEGGRDHIRPMLQNMLANRFHMQMHREKKEFPVYALVVAKSGLKMKELAPLIGADAEEGGRGAVNVAASGGRGGVSASLGKGSFFSFANDKFELTRVTMQSFAETLARFLDRPVLDMTELTGEYTFTLALTAEDYRNMQIQSAIIAGVVLPPEARRLAENASNDSLHTALQALGLRLEARKAPIDVLVIDKMDKTPTEN